MGGREERRSCRRRQAPGQRLLNTRDAVERSANSALAARGSAAGTRQGDSDRVPPAPRGGRRNPLEVALDLCERTTQRRELSLQLGSPAPLASQIFAEPLDVLVAHGPPTPPVDVSVT